MFNIFNRFYYISMSQNEKQLLQELEFLGDHWARQDQENTVKVFEIIAHDEKLQNARESV
jgi:hypothetical protein